MLSVGLHVFLITVGSFAAGPPNTTTEIGSTPSSTIDYSIHSRGDGWLAHNRGQSWDIAFDGHSFQASPPSKAWVWGLELASYGFGANRLSVTATIGTSVEGGELAYDWGNGLTEWYINDERGLEHGFTFQERPAMTGTDGPLTLQLDVQGSWEPCIATNRTDVTFAHRTISAAVD